MSCKKSQPSTHSTHRNTAPAGAARSRARCSTLRRTRAPSTAAASTRRLRHPMWCMATRTWRFCWRCMASWRSLTASKVRVPDFSARGTERALYGHEDVVFLLLKECTPNPLILPQAWSTCARAASPLPIRCCQRKRRAPGARRSHCMSRWGPHQGCDVRGCGFLNPEPCDLGVVWGDLSCMRVRCSCSNSQSCEAFGEASAGI